MSKLTILAGDFCVGKESRVFGSTFTIRKAGFWPRFETVPMSDLDTVDVASEESVKRLGGTIGWGVAGAVLLGPIGLLAGLLVGGQRKNVTFVARFQDGRRMLGTIDAKAYTNMLAAVFRRPAVV